SVLSWVWRWGANDITRQSRGSIPKGRGLDISRVLFQDASTPGELSIWDVCYQTPQAVPPNDGAGKRPTLAPATLLPTGVYRASTSRYCWCALTAPLHPYPTRHQVSVKENCSPFPVKGGMFLWHYPHARAHWALPSKSGL
ncbi:MAG: hypothetical protein RLZZ568_663, partial [Cyanobacteriota bacterium]